jgi:hypothetical protein
MVYCDFRGFLFSVLIFINIRINVEREAFHQQSPMHMRAFNHNGAKYNYAQQVRPHIIFILPLY